jgi:hypothetical protein
MNNINRDENGFYIPMGEMPLVQNSSFIGFNGRRNNSIKPFNGYELREVLPIDATLAEDSDPYQNAIGVGRKGRVAGRKAKREAKKSGASNKEARAAKKTTKATYAKEDSRRKDVLERRAKKLTVKATTKFGSEERKAGMKEVREERREQIKKNAKKFVVLSITAPILGAAMALMAINFRGMATKTATATLAEQAKMKKRWERMGGSFKNFMSVAQNNKDKKPFMCAAKCKKDLASFVEAKGAKAALNEIPTAIVTDTYSNAVETAAIGAAIAAGGTLVASLISMIGKKKETAAVEAEVEAQDKINQDELDKLSALDKQRIKLAEDQLKEETNWKAKIMEDPNLSEDEKREAIKLYESTDNDAVDWKKIGMIAGGALLVGGLLYFIISGLKGQKSVGA